MELNKNIKTELKRVMWDYQIDEAMLWEIWEGRKETFSLSKTKLRARLLLSTSWYQLLDCFGIQGLKEILTDEVINSFWIKESRAKFQFAKDMLHGLS